MREREREEKLSSKSVDKNESSKTRAWLTLTHLHQSHFHGKISLRTLCPLSTHLIGESVDTSVILHKRVLLFPYHSGTFSLVGGRAHTHTWGIYHFTFTLLSTSNIFNFFYKQTNVLAVGESLQGRVEMKVMSSTLHSVQLRDNRQTYWIVTVSSETSWMATEKLQ